MVSFFKNVGTKFSKAGQSIKRETNIALTKIRTKRDLLKSLNFNQLKSIYETETGKKAEKITKDFNTGKVLSKRLMTRSELENKLFLSQAVTIDKIATFIKKMNNSTQTKKQKQNTKSKKQKINFNIRI